MHVKGPIISSESNFETFRYCRFQKCLAAGLSPDKVKMFKEKTIERPSHFTLNSKFQSVIDFGNAIWEKTTLDLIMAENSYEGILCRY